MFISFPNSEGIQLCDQQEISTEGTPVLSSQRVCGLMVVRALAGALCCVLGQDTFFTLIEPLFTQVKNGYRQSYCWK